MFTSSDLFSKNKNSLEPGEVALQVGELGSQEKEEAHDTACDDSEDGLHQDPILKWIHGTEIGALPVRVEHFARVGVELVDETTWIVRRRLIGERAGESASAWQQR